MWFAKVISLQKSPHIRIFFLLFFPGGTIYCPFSADTELSSFKTFYIIALSRDLIIRERNIHLEVCRTFLSSQTAGLKSVYFYPFINFIVQ